MKAEEWIDPLFPSAVLVSYLNELPSPVLPSDMYEKFIGICGKILRFLNNLSFANKVIVCHCYILNQTNLITYELSFERRTFVFSKIP